MDGKRGIGTWKTTLACARKYLEQPLQVVITLAPSLLQLDAIAQALERDADGALLARTRRGWFFPQNPREFKRNRQSESYRSRSLPAPSSALALSFPLSTPSCLTGTN